MIGLYLIFIITTKVVSFKWVFFCLPPGHLPVVMLPPTLGVALLCSCRAGSDMWLYPELITFALFTVMG